jgi:predicted Rossmann fold nucleotide-binding protein DprA/Smf involved in DNA uptake
VNEITAATVLHAVHALRDLGTPPSTAEEIAEHLKIPVDEVQPRLVELKARRILRDRRNGTRREWSRW